MKNVWLDKKIESSVVLLR